MSEIQKEYERFLKLVEDMRQAQTDYFSYKTGPYLILAKSLEHKVDLWIQHSKQASLFGKKPS